MRGILPGRSLTRALPSGRNTRDQGISRFSIQTRTSTASPSTRETSSTAWGLPPITCEHAARSRRRQRERGEEIRLIPRDSCHRVLSCCGRTARQQPSPLPFFLSLSSSETLPHSVLRQGRSLLLFFLQRLPHTPP